MKILNKQLIFKRKLKLPIILQDEIAECGHTCILMISAYYGYITDKQRLRKIHKPSIKGITMLEINNILETLNFKTRALKVPLHAIKHIKTPAILHWNMNHFVVLKKVKRNTAYIHDPAIGYCKFNLEEFSKAFTGIVLEVETTSNFQKINHAQKLTLPKIVSTLPFINKLLAYLLLLSICIETLTLINPLFLQYITDHVLSSNSYNNLYTIAIGFLIIICIKTLAEYTRESLVLYTTTRFSESFATNVFQHLISLPVSFFTSRHQGDIQSKFHVINQIKSKISNEFINTLLDGVMFTITLAMMLVYSLKLSVISIISIALYTCLRYISYQSLRAASASSVQMHAKLASQFLETLKAITTLKLFLKEKSRFIDWQNGYINALNSDIKIGRQQILYKITNHFLFSIEHIITICIGANLVTNRKMSVGMLLAFLAYRQILVDKSSALVQNIFDYQLLSIHLNRLSDIVFAKGEDYSQTKQLNTMNITSISIKNICFHYENSVTKILKNLSFRVEQGEKVAIVGASGCGKTTLLKILMGLLLPTKGNVYINNIPLQTYGINNFLGKIAAVLQDDNLLSGSILENITFFADEIDLEQVYSAAKIAQIHQTICELPMGYETLIGDMGSILSGGQKQRLLLARALYKKPQVLFLDEATSHLDTNNETHINSRLKSMQITQIIIAHRQETINMVDRVIKLA